MPFIEASFQAHSFQMTFRVVFSPGWSVAGLSRSAPPSHL